MMEIESASGNIMKTYIYGNSELLAQHDGDTSADRYFYLHDRLGSVRLVIDDQSAVKNTYTYEPFGEMFATECTETTENPFKFTGQYFDSEIEEYYLRARQYSPQIARFTSRDPVKGTFLEPMTVHQYLYCLNDPINRTDLSGGKSLSELMTSMSVAAGTAASTGYAFAQQAWRLAGEVYMAAYVRAAEIGWFVQGISMGSNRPAYNPMTLANRLHHIFDSSELGHELDPLVNYFGSQAGAFMAVHGATATKLSGAVSGVFTGLVVSVEGFTVAVNGAVIDGLVQISTFYWPG